MKFLKYQWFKCTLLSFIVLLGPQAFSSNCSQSLHTRIQTILKAKKKETPLSKAETYKKLKTFSNANQEKCGNLLKNGEFDFENTKYFPTDGGPCQNKAFLTAFSSNNTLNDIEQLLAGLNVYLNIKKSIKITGKVDADDVNKITIKAIRGEEGTTIADLGDGKLSWHCTQATPVKNECDDDKFNGKEKVIFTRKNKDYTVYATFKPASENPVTTTDLVSNKLTIAALKKTNLNPDKFNFFFANTEDEDKKNSKSNKVTCPIEFESEDKNITFESVTAQLDIKKTIINGCGDSDEDEENEEEDKDEDEGEEQKNKDKTANKQKVQSKNCKVTFKQVTANKVSGGAYSIDVIFVATDGTQIEVDGACGVAQAGQPPRQQLPGQRPYMSPGGMPQEYPPPRMPDIWSAPGI
ncbi:MAG: hypothetical protein ISR65_06490 [Bacteriovoracaceae bacterium]|nr:hypothetical protein [Candidatus Brocadiales bacterium]MBL6989405.1 hypothetical protein [Bacteriovoracaceae bacterium]